MVSAGNRRSNSREALQGTGGGRSGTRRDQRSGEAGHNRLSPVLGIRNPVNLGKAAQHSQLRRPPTAAISTSGSGMSAAAPDHNEKRSTSFAANTSRSRSVIALASASAFASTSATATAQTEHSLLVQPLLAQLLLVQLLFGSVVFGSAAFRRAAFRRVAGFWSGVSRLICEPLISKRQVFLKSCVAGAVSTIAIIVRRYWPVNMPTPDRPGGKQDQIFQLPSQWFGPDVERLCVVRDDATTRRVIQRDAMQGTIALAEQNASALALPARHPIQYRSAAGRPHDRARFHSGKVRGSKTRWCQQSEFSLASRVLDGLRTGSLFCLSRMNGETVIREELAPLIIGMSGVSCLEGEDGAVRESLKAVLDYLDENYPVFAEDTSHDARDRGRHSRRGAGAGPGRGGN